MYRFGSMRQHRLAGISLNVHTARYIMMSIMEESGKAHMLSPHLTSMDVKVDRSRFICSDAWIHTILRKRLRWTWLLGSKAAQGLPTNLESIKLDCMHRIAAMVRALNVPKERFYLADATLCASAPFFKVGFLFR